MTLFGITSFAFAQTGTPGPVSYFSVYGGNGTVSLVWGPPNDPGQSEIDDYRVQVLRSDNSHIAYHTVTKSSHELSGGTTLRAPNDELRKYIIQARNQQGYGTVSETLEATPYERTTPERITITATQTNNSIQLSWSAPGDGGAPILRYDLYAFCEDQPTISKSPSYTATSFTLNNLENGKACVIFLQAENGVGNGDATKITVTPGSGTTGSSSYLTPTELQTYIQQNTRATADQPSNIQATSGRGEITLSWDKPSNDGNSPITGYKIRHQVSGASTWTITTIDGMNTTSKTFTGLTNGTSYTFQILTVNGVGDGSWSSEISDTPATLPDAPTGLTIDSVGDGAVTLSWTAPTNDGGSTIIGYKVEFQLGSSWHTFADSTDSPATIKNLVNQTTYSFRVSATNGVGTGTPSITSATPTNVVLTVPDAPTNLHARAGNGQVTLTWDAPHDGNTPIIDYEIEYSTDGSSWILFSNDFISDATSDTVVDLTNGTKYYFRVYAENSEGFGDTSKEVTAIPTSSSPTPPVRPTPTPPPSTPPPPTPSPPTSPTPSPPTPTLGAPTNLQTTSDDSQVTLTWDAPSNTGSSPVTNYIIHYRTDGAWIVFDDDINTTSATITDLENGVSHSFRVYAENSTETGASSRIVSATPFGAPDAITGLVATPEDGQVTLTWNVPNDGGREITNYIIQYNLDGSQQTIDDGIKDSTSVTITGLTNEIMYEFLVRAVNSVGEGEPSSILVIPSETYDYTEYDTRTIGILVPTNNLSIYETIHYAVKQFNTNLTSQDKDWRLKISVYSNSDSLTGIQSFHNMGIKAVIGPANNESSISQFIEENDMLAISYGSTLSTLEIDDNIFRITINDDNLTLILSELFVNDQIKNVIPVYRDDEWGNALYDSISEVLDDSITVYPGIKYSTNYSEITTQLEQYRTNSSAIILLGFEEVIPIIDAAATSNILTKFKWYSTDHFIDELLLDEIRSKFMSDVSYTIVTQSVSPNDINENLNQVIPNSNVYTYAAYDSVFILGEAIDIVGSVDIETLVDTIPDIAANHTSALNDTTLNQYGDLAIVSYDIKTVSNGQLIHNGTHPIPNVESSNTLDVIVFHDVNSNGVKDTDEDGIQTSVHIQTPPIDGFTNYFGKYSFVDPPSGTKVVHITIPDGFIPLPGNKFYQYTDGEMVSFPLVYRNPTTGSIALSVVSNNSPVENALVVLDTTPQEIKLTDSAGKVTFQKLEPDTYDILLSFVGYQNSSQSLTVVAGKETSIPINLLPVGATPTGTVSGTVTPGIATITIDTTPPQTTNSTDNYLFTNILPGTYTISASADGYLDSSSTVTITANSTSLVNFDLIPDIDVTIIVFNDDNNNGTLDAGETPLSDATILLGQIKMNGGNTYTSISNSEGMHTFEDILADSYSIFVKHDSKTEFIHVVIDETRTIHVGL